MPDSECVIVTCEHGGNAIPPELAARFVGCEDLLAGHRGFDWGALPLAREIARRQAAPLFHTTVSRLVVDCNRREGSPTLFSEFTADLDTDEKNRLLDLYYRPFRASAERAVAEAIAQGRRVLHLSIHSFTPVMNGVERKADIGWLYDPRRRREVEFCDAWRAALLARKPPYRLRRNYPYTGYSDGFATHLRKRFPGDAYAGMELEVNRRHVAADSRFVPALTAFLLDSLDAALPPRSRDV